MNRRSFILGAAALALSSGVAMPSIIRKAPIRIGEGSFDSPMDGVNSDSAAFNAAVNEITAQANLRGTSTIMASGILTLDDYIQTLDRHYIAGDGPLGLVINFTAPASKQPPGTAIFRWQGRAGFTGGGMINVGFPATSATSGRYMIYVAGAPGGFTPAEMLFENLYLGSTGNAAHAPFRHIELVGHPSSSPAGIRRSVMRNVTCFGSTSGASVFIDRAFGMSVNGLALYPAPAGLGAGLQVNNSWNCNFSNLDLQGGLGRSNNSACEFRAISGATL